MDGLTLYPLMRRTPDGRVDRITVVATDGNGDERIVARITVDDLTLDLDVDTHTDVRLRTTPLGPA